MTIRELWESPTTSSTLAGVEIGQAWKDLLLWETFFNKYEIKSCLELGTWRGGMAVFLALQCHCRSMPFVTIDRVGCNPNALRAVQILGGKLFELDIFSDHGEQQIRQIIRELPKPLVLFCDNGNKREEFRRLVPEMASGDFVAVHDWGTEFCEADVVHQVEGVLAHECEELSSLTRFYRT